MPQVGGITAHLRIWRLNHLVHRTCEVTVTDDRPGPKDRSPGTFRAFRTPRFREDISGRGGGVRSCHSEGGHTAAAPDGSPGRDFRRAANYEKRACDAAVSGSPLASVSCRYPHSCQGRLLLPSVGRNPSRRPDLSCNSLGTLGPPRESGASAHAWRRHRATDPGPSESLGETSRRGVLCRLVVAETVPAVT